MNESCSLGDNALYFAMCARRGDVARTLLHAGAQVNVSQRDLLSSAIDHGLIKTAAQMIENGAYVSRGALAGNHYEEIETTLRMILKSLSLILPAMGKDLTGNRAMWAKSKQT